MDMKYTITIPKEFRYDYIRDKFKDTFELEDCWWLQDNISWLKSVEPEYTEGLLTYYKNKFDIDVWQTLLDKIKSFNN